MIKFRQKDFSIQEGGYKGGKRELNKASYPKRIGFLAGGGAVAGAAVGFKKAAEIGVSTAAKGGLIGAGLGLAAGAAIGAFSAWMHNKCDESAFNSGLSNGANSHTLISILEDNYLNTNPDCEEINVTKTVTDDATGATTTIGRKTVKNNDNGVVAKGIVYNVDGDPNKYVISAYYSANVLVLYINRPKNHELSFLNKILDNYCNRYKNADYTATQIRNGVYEVEVAVVSGTETYLCEQLVDSGFCLNIITGNKI